MNYDQSRETALALINQITPSLPQDPTLAFDVIRDSIVMLSKEQATGALTFLLLSECGKRQTMDQLTGNRP